MTQRTRGRVPPRAFVVPSGTLVTNLYAISDRRTLWPVCRLTAFMLAALLTTTVRGCAGGGAIMADTAGQVHPDARAGQRGRHWRPATGGPADQEMDQPIVIENRPGGDGILAINAFVGQDDPHPAVRASSSFIGHPYQHDNLPYKPDDLAPIARVSNTVVESRCRWTYPSDAQGRRRAAALSQANLTGPA